MAYGVPEYDSVIDAYKCEICRGWYRALGSHLKYHNISAEEYKKKFGFNRNQSFLAKDICKIKRQHALENKTYLNVKEGGKPHHFKKKDERRYYERRSQTKQILRVLRRISKKRKIL